MVKEWSFITNHGLVLLYVSNNPQCTMRDMAAALSVTERTIKRILEDLQKEGYISWHRTGKGNIYEVNDAGVLRHDLTRDVVLSELLELLSGGDRE